MQPGALNIAFTRGDDYDRELTFYGRPSGSDGKVLLYGDGVPPASLGSDGNYYIDKTAKTSYGPKTAGAWGSSTPLTPLDYSAMTFSAQIRQFEDDDEPVTAFTVDDSDADTGIVVLSLTAEQTALLERVYAWDLQIIDGALKTRTLIAGVVSVKADVTRALP